jgi:hypothetical protein
MRSVVGPFALSVRPSTRRCSIASKMQPAPGPHTGIAVSIAPAPSHPQVRPLTPPTAVRRWTRREAMHGVPQVVVPALVVVTRMQLAARLAQPTSPKHAGRSRTPGISCEAVPASEMVLRGHEPAPSYVPCEQLGNGAGESFVSFIPLFGGHPFRWPRCSVVASFRCQLSSATPSLVMSSQP